MLIILSYAMQALAFGAAAWMGAAGGITVYAASWVIFLAGLAIGGKPALTAIKTGWRRLLPKTK